jgi:hypothetical protein
MAQMIDVDPNKHGGISSSSPSPVFGVRHGGISSSSPSLVFGVRHGDFDACRHLRPYLLLKCRPSFRVGFSTVLHRWMGRQPSDRFLNWDCWSE